MDPNLFTKQTLLTVTINIHYIITWYRSIQSQQQSEHSKSAAAETRTKEQQPKTTTKEVINITNYSL